MAQGHMVHACSLAVRQAGVNDHHWSGRSAPSGAERPLQRSHNGPASDQVGSKDDI
jgi:hypothetical protein